MEGAGQVPAGIEVLRHAWPLRLFTGGPDSWWLIGGAALTVHFGGRWRPLGDFDVTINRTQAVTTAINRSTGTEAPWAEDFRAWFAAGPTNLPGNCPFVVNDSFDLPASFRTVELLPGLWYSTSRPELVVKASEAVLCSESGLPYLAPELVLMGKSRQRRPKDREDFDRAVPRLEPEIRTRLLGLLPAEHPWRRGGQLADLPERGRPSDSSL